MINQSANFPASQALPLGGSAPATGNRPADSIAGDTRSDSPVSKHSNTAPAGIVTLSEQGRTLQSSAGSLSLSAGSEVTAADKLARSQHSADVILGFINTHIDRLASDGATEQEMAAAINDGLAGFSSGFSEAMNFLDQAGFLSDALSEELALTQQLILAGIEDLRGQFAPHSSSEASEPVAVTYASVNSNVVSGYRSSSDSVSTALSGGFNGTVQSQQASFIEDYQRYQSTSLEVVTRDGDKISISYQALQQLQRSGALSQHSGDNGNSLSAAFAEEALAAGEFAIRIEGELDEGELLALTELMKQVNELADEFFNGDFEKAFSMAVELKMDTTELAAMSLNMQRTTSYSATQAYNNVQNFGASASEQQQQLPPGLQKLGSLVNNLIEMLEKANNFAEPITLLSDLLANRLAQQQLAHPEKSAGPTAGRLDRLLSDVARP